MRSSRVAAAGRVRPTLRAALIAGAAIVILADCTAASPGDRVDAVTASTALVPSSETTLAPAPSPLPTSTRAPTLPPVPTPSPLPTSDATSTPVPTLDQAFVLQSANKVEVVDGTFLVVLIDADSGIVEASVGTDRQDRTPTATDVFRIGSITKVFTALATLTLVDEGLVDLDAPAADYVTRVPVPERVLVRDLLAHRSGIADTTSVEGFIPQLLVDQSRVWSPEEQLDLIADRPSESPPGVSFSYSNSNYVLLGVLLEEVTGQRYHEVVRSRILGPLEMTSTYLAGFEQGRAPFDPYTNSSVTATGQPYDYTSIASAAWAAGAMVSSAVDLHRLFSALFEEQVISDELVNEMTRGTNYGLGLELRDSSSGLVGHEGGIPGYSTFLRYSMETGTTAFFALTDDGANPLPARRPIIDALARAASQ